MHDYVRVRLTNNVSYLSRKIVETNILFFSFKQFSYVFLRNYHFNQPFYFLGIQPDF